ncbi:protein yippee-like At4g27745 isoform X1 [Cucumis sativus]|uniref:protein yippee-like At4g27745 isoform X1 n=1 Tax=Cucumis sativus TaxID=3659 RepID=UPI0012F4B0DC|nr:protein yippee-like At4g27745 isoform X1 [Cucumis sativus]
MILRTLLLFIDFWVTIDFIGERCLEVFLLDDQWLNCWGLVCTAAVIVGTMLPFTMISFLKLFRHGRAFLFSHAMNITVGPKEDRHLMTGLHTVADVHCVDCREVLGWKYERAYEASQKYKEGKFILEKSKIVRDNW